MGYLQGLEEYLEAGYARSVFDQALSSQKIWQFHLHGHRIARANVLENTTYEVKLKVEGQGEEVVPKIQVKFLYPAELSEAVKPLLKVDEKVKALKLEPIRPPQDRYHVKNKSLFPLMKDREVLLFTLLEGELIRGIVLDFSRYDLTVGLKGGVPLTILRHSVYDLRDKKGRSFLKPFQDKHRDWEKSGLFVSQEPSGGKRSSTAMDQPGTPGSAPAP